jgi:hypothetical protein
MSLPRLPFTLFPKRTKTVVLLLVSSVFVAGSVLMIYLGEPIGWLGAVFFGLAALVFLVQLLSKNRFLTISEEGIEFHSLFHAERIRWTDVSTFGVYQTGPGPKLVGFNYSSDYPGATKGRSVARALAGFEGRLPDTYGLSADDLALLLSEYHREMTQPPGR